MTEHTPMTDMLSFKREDGSYDWNGYEKARVANGEKCRTCGQFINWHKGYPTLCYQCRKETPAKEFDHSIYVRCPYCGHKWAPYEVACDDGDVDVMYDGDHEVSCYECNKEFEVRTEISYFFTSPPMKKEELSDIEEKSPPLVGGK